MEAAEMTAWQINPDHLGEVVAQMLGSPAKLVEWTARPIYGGVEDCNALLRCQGVAEVGAGELRPWSLVIKIISAKDKNNDPAGSHYWKREALAYQSGFFRRMPKSLAAPLCFAVKEGPGNCVWIWMEDVHDDTGGAWTLETTSAAAYQLGLFNGAFLAGKPLLSEAWFAPHWLRTYVEDAASMIAFIRRNPDHPLVRSLYGGNLPLIMGVWATRSTLLDILDRMPQVFCHQDAFKRNLFFQHGQLVAVDWSYAGMAPIGTELVALVAVSLGFGNTPGEKIFELDQLCFNEYMRGLQDAGARVAPRTIRRCFTLSILLRYILGANVGEMLPALMDTTQRQRIAQTYEETPEEASKTQDAIARFYMAMFKEAALLMGFWPLLKIAFWTVWFSRPGRKV